MGVVFVVLRLKCRVGGVLLVSGSGFCWSPSDARKNFLTFCWCRCQGVFSSLSEVLLATAKFGSFDWGVLILLLELKKPRGYRVLLLCSGSGKPSHLESRSFTAPSPPSIRLWAVRGCNRAPTLLVERERVLGYLAFSSPLSSSPFLITFLSASLPIFFLSFTHMFFLLLEPNRQRSLRQDGC